MNAPSPVQPYYRAYMNAEGFTDPAALWARDRNGAPFIIWISQQRRDFATADADDFGAWLAARYPTPAEARAA